MRIADKLWSHLEDKGIPPETIFEHTQNIANTWDLLFPAEQQRICRLLIDRVWFKDNGITIDFHKAGLTQLIGEVS